MVDRGARRRRSDRSTLEKSDYAQGSTSLSRNVRIFIRTQELRTSLTLFLLARLPSLVCWFREQLFNLAPFAAVRSASPLEAMLTPPVAVENVSRVAAAGALGRVPGGVLLVDDINRLAADCA